MKSGTRVEFHVSNGIVMYRRFQLQLRIGQEAIPLDLRQYTSR